MILDIPIRYQAHVIAPRRRKGESHDLADVARVELREVTEGEAPVAAWWSEHEPAMQSALRSHEGVLYAPFAWAEGQPREQVLATGADDGGAHREHPRTTDAWLAGRRTPRAVSATAFAGLLGQGVAGVRHGQARALRGPSAPRVDAVPDGKLVRSGLDAERDLQRRAIGDLLSVGGILYRKVGVPLLAVDAGPFGRPEIRPNWADDAFRPRALAFSLTEHPAAVAAWRKAAVAEGAHQSWMDDPSEPPGRSGRMPEPEILRSDLLPAWDSLAMATRDVARAVLATLEDESRGAYSSHPWGVPRVATYDRPVMRAYARLRDALAAQGGRDGLVEGLADLAEACERHGTLHSVRDEARALLARVADAEADADLLAGLDDLDALPSPGLAGAP